MKKLKLRASTWLLEPAVMLLPALVGCEFQPDFADTTASSIALSEGASFVQDFARQVLAAFLF